MRNQPSIRSPWVASQKSKPFGKLDSNTAHQGHQTPEASRWASHPSRAWWPSTHPRPWHKLWSQLKHVRPGKRSMTAKTPPKIVFLHKHMNQGGLETLLIERSMDKLLMHQLLHLPLRPQHAQNLWLLIAQLVAIQPGIAASPQPHRLKLISDSV